MLQVRFRLRNDGGNSFHARANVRNFLGRRRELARNDEIKAVGQALVVNERIPFRFLHFLQLENRAFDVVFQDAKIDAIRPG